MQISSATELDIYKRAYRLAMDVFDVSNADGENAETGTWLDFAKDCGYLKPEEHIKLIEDCHATGAMLGTMMKNPKPFLINHRGKI